MRKAHASCMCGKVVAGGGGVVEVLKGSVVLLQPTKDKRQLGMSQGQSCQDCFLLFHST